MYTSPRMHVHPERQLLLHGVNSPDSSLVLSTDAKPRLKWTPELHERFREAVNQLGGAEKATPKMIMKLMKIPGLTLYHLKSHLQKYRLSKNPHIQGNSRTNKAATISYENLPETNGNLVSSNGIEHQMNKNIHITNELQMQIEVQRRLHEQLEVQRHLQLRIEAQGKYLQTILEKAQNTLGKQDMDGAGLEDAKLQLSELVYKVSTQRTQPAQNQLTADCSIDSCLSTCDLQGNVGLGLRLYGDQVKANEQKRISILPQEHRPITFETIKFPIGIGSELDLNARDDESEGVSRRKHLDLNG